MSSQQETAIAALAASLAAFLPARVVGRDLVDPADVAPADLQAGVLCLVSRGGGGFANTLGRTGQLGRLELAVVGFVRVDEGLAPAAVETAELELLGDVLRWSKDGAPVTALPGTWRQSQQLEAPYGWFVLELDVRPAG